MSAPEVDPIRVGARVLLVDPQDRVLRIHARDPDQPDHCWWELSGGGLDPGETLPQAAIRELADETGIHLTQLGPCLWIRETRFRYRNREHHRRDHIYLGRPDSTQPTLTLTPSTNEKLGLIEQRWWTPDDLDRTNDKLAPPALPGLVRQILAGDIPADPILLVDQPVRELVGLDPGNCPHLT